MSDEKIVYKLGGSCFKNEKDYRAVAEFLIKDTIASQWPIWVVVSAQYGETDRLIREVRGTKDTWDQIDYMAREGEFRSAEKLAGTLNGVEKTKSALVVTPWEIGMETQGENPFCGELVGIQNIENIQNSVSNNFMIVPGYVGVNQTKTLKGKPALQALGRGASDLIAVEIARATFATLKLIKSAQSIYAVSPEFVNNPKPIRRMTPDQALRVLEYIRSDEQFIMAKAVKHAQRHNVPLEFRSIVNPGLFSRIDAISDSKKETLFRALPVKENVVRVCMIIQPKKVRHLYEELHRKKIPFNDGGSEVINGKIRAHIFAERAETIKIKQLAESLAEDINMTEGSLITLIDTSLDPEGNHFMRIHKALHNVRILHTMSSGIIMHIFVSPRDTKKSVNALAQEFELIEP